MHAAANEQEDTIAGSWFGYASPSNLAGLLSQSGRSLITRLRTEILQKDGPLDQTVDRNMQKLNEAIDENIRRVDEAVERRLSQANIEAKNLVDHTRDRVDETVIRTLQKDGPLDQTVDRNMQKLNKAIDENVRRVDEAADQLLCRANAQAKDLINHTGDRLEQTVARTLQRDGLLDRATDRVFAQATQHLEATANHVVADATGQLRATTQQVVANARKELQEASHHILTHEVQPMGHALIVDLVQNVGKMLLSSTMGAFGAVLAYKNVIDYFESQKGAKVIYAKWQDQEREKYENHEDAGTAILLSKKLKEAGLINSGNEQRVSAYLAAAGATTFVAACVLCCYWIR